MASIRSIFNVQSPYKEDREKFYEFMERHAKPFFSNVGDVRFDVQYLLVRSVINEGRADYKGAKHRKVWLQLSDILRMGQTNSKYYEYHKAVISKMIIDESRGSYERLMNLIQKFIKDFYNSNVQFNVVKYQYQDNRLRSGKFIK